MTLINTCILMLFLQPLFVYVALFTDEIDLNENTSNPNSDPFNLAFLVMTPSFAYFYMEQFWYAFGLLACVSFFGLILAKIVEPKAKRRLEVQRIGMFVFVWLFMFGIGYWLIGLFFDSPIQGANAVEAPESAVSYYEKFWPSLYFLALMVVTLVLKIVEYKFSLKEALSGILIIISAVLVSISPLFGEAYILGLIANFFIFFIFCSACIEIDKISDASGGAIAFLYGYILMMGLGFSIICKLVYEVFF